ncbi:transcriptional regulator [Acidihalobacter yilgarnensis]|uniref:Transcriptional regulator n=1 Tax=Acidihalobacter yilgarnensis TaxID=2819280 RepID=A0A1D8IKV8_9GAMM|nr:LysR family transcriptional regulator [Acidihalobacter yilgarnensis]AOU97106.1 transcriptional regulator [Acidihalobacter yilgarnensis]
MNSIDWRWIRAFLAVAETGSLSAAARALGVSQPTLSREMQALEQTTGLNLLRRTTQGVTLTAAGERLMATAARMGEAADGFAREASGLSAAPAGDVRISVNEVLGTYLLPLALAALRVRYPGIRVDVVITNRVSNLGRREADIALRMFRPAQSDLVVRRLPDIPLGFYAHRNYVAQHGDPRSWDELACHSLIGNDQDRDFIDAAERLGLPIGRADFSLRCDHLPAQIELARAGAGICAMHTGLAARWPSLVPVMSWLSLPPLSCWCVTHRDVRYSAPIAVTMRFLIEWFADDPYAHVGGI